MTMAFWDRTAETYAASKIADAASYERKLDDTRAFLTAESKVLEVGCGTGSTAIRHAPHAARILATDPSPRMIEIARGKAATAGIRNVEFRAADARALDLPDASFDMVMAHSILHLLPDPAAVIERSCRWLRPGGAFVSSTACLADPRWLPARPIIPVLRLFGRAPRVNAFREGALIGWIEAAGFSVRTRWRPRGMAATFVIASAPGREARIVGAAS